MDMLEQLVEQVCVYYLTCDISKEAVDCLAEALEENVSREK